MTRFTYDAAVLLRPLMELVEAARLRARGRYKVAKGEAKVATLIEYRDWERLRDFLEALDGSRLSSPNIVKDEKGQKYIPKLPEDLTEEVVRQVFERMESQASMRHVVHQKGAQFDMKELHRVKQGMVPDGAYAKGAFVQGEILLVHVSKPEVLIWGRETVTGVDTQDALNNALASVTVGYGKEENEFDIDENTWEGIRLD